MIRHSYVPGWFIPGGGIGDAETQENGIIRELREEIGLRSFATVEHLFDIVDGEGGPVGQQSIFLVRDALIDPALSWEIEAIGLFDPDGLPADTHSSTRYRVDRWREAVAADHAGFPG